MNGDHARLGRTPGALSANWIYRWATGVWLIVIAASTAALSYRLLAGVTQSETTNSELSSERDDAESVVLAFGPAEDDRASGIDPLDAPATRVMTYRRRRVRVTFLLRSRGMPPRSLWKLVGFTAIDGRTALSGEEALRRLLNRQ